MTETFFDQLTRALAVGVSRRTAIKAFGLLGGTLLGGFGVRQVTTRAERTYPALVSSLSTTALPRDELKMLKGFLDHVSTAMDILEDIDEYIANVNTCRENGYKEELCQRSASWCLINTVAISQLYPWWVSASQIFDVVKTDCGNGECFQCCYVPGTNYKCHGSFVGFPVINCNPLTEPGARPAGLTLIIDPTSQPGDVCLFVPQTCEHIPLCHHPELGNEKYLTDPRAEARRARAVAEQTVDLLLDFLKEYASSAVDILLEDALLTQVDVTSASGMSFWSFASFLTGRGQPSWRRKITDPATTDWSNPAFIVTDAQGTYLAGPSRLNAIIQLGAMRLIACIPNFGARLAYVESRLWTDQEKQAYLAQISNADEVLLQFMSPEGLTILKQIYALQDYRLLAVPLPDENLNVSIFNGIQLGQPPIVRTTFRAIGSLDIEVFVDVVDPEQVRETLTSLPVFVEWGDGQVDHGILAAGERTITFNHRYMRGGIYRVYTVVENDTGLRGVNALIVATASSDMISNEVVIHPVPAVCILEEVEVVGIPLNTSFYFNIDLVDTKNQRVRAGLSKTVGRGSTANMALGPVVGHNSALLNIDRLVLVPKIVGALPEAGTVLTDCLFSSLSLRLFSTAQQTFVVVTVPLTLKSVKVFVEGSETPLSEDRIIMDDQGRLIIPCLRRTSVFGNVERTTRIEIPLTDEMFSGLMLGRLGADATVGSSRFYVETRPGYFEAVESRIYLPAVRT
jgi:hypothetical protein